MLPLATGHAGQQQPQEKKGDGLSALYMLSVVHSNCFIVFLRSGFGREALATRGFFSLMLLLFCAGCDRRMMVWVVAYLLAIIQQRIITLRAAKRGERVHSLYAGTPWLTKMPLCKNLRNAMVLEMGLCFFVGIFFLPVSRFVGSFMMLGFVSLGLRIAIEDSIFRRRLTRMQDAQIEGRTYGDWMRR